MYTWFMEQNKSNTKVLSNFLSSGLKIVIDFNSWIEVLLLYVCGYMYTY